jgi:type VI secretion system protein ImpJ
VPVRPGACYFSLDARGTLYERMLQAQSAMIYTPSGINDLKLELIAVTS